MTEEISVGDAKREVGPVGLAVVAEREQAADRQQPDLA
jgi:hypothetical protein